jgi:hypothetical protein
MLHVRYSADLFPLAALAHAEQAPEQRALALLVLFGFRFVVIDV